MAGPFDQRYPNIAAWVQDGQVVASQDVKVGPLDPNASASFAAKVEGTGIMAYRMKPIQ